MATQSGPALIVVNPGTSAEVSLSRDQQLQDAILTAKRMNFPHTTQQSEAPTRYIKTGIEVSLQISVADSVFPLIALAFGTSVVTDGIDASKQKIVLSDDAGLDFPTVPVIIKPYTGLTVSTNPNEWITLLNASLVNTQDFTYAYGLKTQRAFSMQFMALPDPDTGVKAIFGDATAQA